MSAMIQAKGLTKKYGELYAVNDISLTIEPNKIYGLLGRNGAGKSTFMQLVTAQAFPTSGMLKVFGEEPYENNHVLKQLCFIKESQKYPDIYRVKDVLDISAVLYPNWDHDYAMSLVEQFNLPLKCRMRKLSRGMLSAVGVIVGLASRAPLTIFDEPYLGLDAVARSLFYSCLLEDYGEHPRTIILSTHLIDEVSNMLEHVFVIDKGKLIIDSDAEELRGQAFNIVGAAAKVNTFANGRTIIHQETIGGLTSVTFQGKLDQTDRLQAKEMGLELTPVSLQQMVIHLTKQNQGAEVVS